MKKFLIGLTIFVILANGFYVWQKSINNTEIVKTEKTVTVSFLTPKNLIIPSIGVDAVVEQVGMDEKGRMDVPKKVENVAWYNLGAKPGDLGSAVLAGHLDDIKGEPAVFYNLSNLSKGDLITVVDEKDKKLTFEVEKIEIFDSNSFPLNDVFANSSGKRLNLITCNGTWDEQNENYEKRLVIFSKLKEN